MDHPQGISTAKACLNCGGDVQYAYCGHCGESYPTHRLTISHMLHEVVHLFTHFDKGFLYTLKRLTLTPGKMQKAYIAGMRQNHQKPFSMLLVCGTLAALAIYWINRAVMHIHHDEMDADQLKFYQHNFAILQMVLVPVYALVNWLFYLKSKYNYAEFLVILLYNTSFLMMVVIVANSLKLILGMVETGYYEMVIVLSYNIITYLNIFNGDKKWVIIAKALITSFICFAVSRFAEEIFIHRLLAGQH